MTIDASGRDIFTLSKTNGRKWDPVLNKMAVWTYYRGALRDPGIDAGSTTVAMVPERGWFWYIPLPDDVVSVGVVAEKDYLFGQPRDLADIFHGEVEKNLWIKQHLAQGQQFGKYHTTREYSYRGEHSAEDGLVLVGDALAFLDPVFSSGVYLALKSGEMAADTVHEALLAGDVSAARFGPYAERMCREIESMRKLVYVFYHQSFSFGKLIRANPDIRGDLTDCLIGNLDKDFQQLFQAVEEQAAIPEPLPHGRPRRPQQMPETIDRWKMRQDDFEDLDLPSFVSHCSEIDSSMPYEFHCRQRVEFADTEWPGSSIFRISSATWSGPSTSSCARSACPCMPSTATTWCPGRGSTPSASTVPR